MGNSHITNEKEKIYKGLHKAAEVVGSTMGAHGKYVLINDRESRFTKDGITVASALPQVGMEGIGTELVVNSSQKTVEMEGDGTTQTAVLLSAMAKTELPVNKRLFLEDMDSQIEGVINALEANSKSLTTIDEVYDIATTSGNSTEVGDMMKEIYGKVGFESRIILEEDEDSPESYFTVDKGVEFKGNTGYASERFGNQRNKYCIFENAFVIIDENKHSVTEKYKALLQQAAKAERPIVFISPFFSNEVVSMCLGNLQKGIQVCLVKSPGWGRNKTENYRDIRALIGSEGVAKKIVITPVAFTIFSDEDLTKRITAVEDELEGYMQEHEVIQANVRINKLRGSTAVIFAGGITAKNMKEEFDRLEDAIGAVQSAIEGGYSKGAGIALSEAAKGSKIEDICNAPAFKIKENAELPQDLKEINVITKEECDLLEEGIIDPTRVIVTSLRNAFASFSLLTNTDYIIQYEV